MSSEHPPDPYRYDKPIDSLPKDGPEFAWRTIERLKLYFVEKQTTAEAFARVVAEAEAYEVWNHWPKDRPYGSKEVMAERELHTTWVKVKRDRDDRMRMAADKTDGKVLAKGRRSDDPEKMGKLPIYPRQERSSAAGISLKQQKKLDALACHPDQTYIMAVRAGTKSVHAAWLAAGFGCATITVPLDPEKMARAIRRRLSDDEIDALIEALGEVE